MDLRRASEINSSGPFGAERAERGRKDEEAKWYLDGVDVVSEQRTWLDASG